MIAARQENLLANPYRGRQRRRPQRRALFLQISNDGVVSVVVSATHSFVIECMNVSAAFNQQLDRVYVSLLRGVQEGHVTPHMHIGTVVVVNIGAETQQSRSQVIETVRGAFL